MGTSGSRTLSKEEEEHRKIKLKQKNLHEIKIMIMEMRKQRDSENEQLDLKNTDALIWCYFYSLPEGRLETTIIQNLIMLGDDESSRLQWCIQSYYKNKRLDIKKLRRLAADCPDHRIILYTNFIIEKWKEWKTGESTTTTTVISSVNQQQQEERDR